MLVSPLVRQYSYLLNDIPAIARKQAESRSSGVGTIVLKIRQVKLVEPTHNSNPACEVPNSVVTLGTGGVCIGQVVRIA